MGVTYQPACAAAMKTSNTATLLAMTTPIASRGCSPRSRSACTSWLLRSSNAPNVVRVPSGSTTAMSPRWAAACLQKLMTRFGSILSPVGCGQPAQSSTTS